MKLAIKDLINSKEALQKLFSENLPVKTSYRLGRAIKHINSELKDFEDKRIELLKKYGDVVDDKISVKAENMESFTKDINDLLQVELDLAFEPVAIDEIKDAKLSAIDMANLEKFIFTPEIN